MWTLRRNSLWFRLLLSSAIVSATLLFGAALLLNAIFVNALRQSFDEKLRADLDGLLAAVELSPTGKPFLTNQLADSRFGLPLSGWYWQVSDPATHEVFIASASLLESKIPLSSAEQISDQSGTVAYSAVDVGSKNLRVIHRDVNLFGSAKTVDFRISGNFDELNGEIGSFQKTLFLVLAGLGLALLTAIILQVRFGLRPLGDLQQRLTAVRSGRAERLDGNFPDEIQPLATELNLLVDANRDVLERSRMQVGNLAHALKTPLSVMTNEINASKTQLAQLLREQIQIMRDQVDLYLDRARRAARARSLGAATEVAPVVEALARTVMRINQSRKLSFQNEVPAGFKFRGEKQDLEEMLGNLLDNAGKWANSTARIRAAKLPTAAQNGRAWMDIIVEDDGPGVPESLRNQALKRGQRLDETISGSGLGLSIIAETAAMYSGDFLLESSELGGLKARLRLPMVV